MSISPTNESSPSLDSCVQETVDKGTLGLLTSVATHHSRLTFDQIQRMTQQDLLPGLGSDNIEEKLSYLAEQGYISESEQKYSISQVGLDHTMEAWKEVLPHAKEVDVEDLLKGAKTQRLSSIDRNLTLLFSLMFLNEGKLNGNKVMWGYEQVFPVIAGKGSVFDLIELISQTGYNGREYPQSYPRSSVICEDDTFSLPELGQQVLYRNLNILYNITSEQLDK